MFDFQKLEVYKKSKTFNIEVDSLIQKNIFNRTIRDQLHRASFSIMLNIAEGTSRYSKRDKKNFYVIARGSVFECVAILEYLMDVKKIDDKTFKQYYCNLEELSRMLYSLIHKLAD